MIPILSGTTAFTPSTPPPSTPWMPAQLGTKLSVWWNAKAPSDITVATGVSNWEAATGSNVPIEVSQTTASEQPAYNGTDLVSFDGGDVLRPSTSLGETSTLHQTAFGIFFVGSVAASSNRQRILNSAVSGSTRLLLSVSGSASDFTFHAGGFSNTTTTTGATASNDNILYCAATDPNVALFLNGTANSTNTNHTSISSAATGFAIGAADLSTITDPATMDLYTVLLIKGTLTTDERQRLEGWAAHNYGLTALLPSGHPYKSSAPTV